MNRFLAFLIIVFAMASTQAFATHIVGGEFTYVCTGGNNYRVTLDIYRDCLEGDPQAISQDEPGYFVVFEGNGNFYRFDSLRYDGIPFVVSPNFTNSCVNNPPRVCLQKARFTGNYFLPDNATGYYIVYQRCCRNGSVMNVTNPGAVGATYFCRIPPANTVRCNSSAVFRNFPPQIICINNPLVYDHSATDANGDSLSYEFCTAYDGGSANNAKPVPSNINFNPINYAPPYSAVTPIFSNPNLQINPTTGLITGTPNELGRYVVTVCCNEWREGRLINTVKREFQFVVTNCSRAVVANIPQYSEEFNTYIINCKDKIIKFDNLSTGGYAYSWDFGVPGMNDDTSNAFSPTFIYPDTGTYTVKLVVNRGSTCPDSITRFVKVYPEFTGDFAVSGLPCPNAEMFFTDASSSTFKPINSWRWYFGDTTYSTEQNPVHRYKNGGKYRVVFIPKNIKGCTDTVRRDIDVERFRPFSGVKNDTLIVKGERINFRASGGAFYTWTPSTFLDNPFISNPVGYYPDTGFITYVVRIKSEVGCEGDDTISVRVVNQSILFVPSGFTPNGDGNNDILRPIGIGYRKVNYFRVYNRWGEQVFYTVYFGEGWDGRVRGREADLGTYFWQLSTEDRFGREEKMSGDATLIR